LTVGALLPSPSVGLAAARVGAVRLGIEVDAVVQAIPVPAAQALLPRRQGALCGVVPHEGVLVPVVDLARWVEVGQSTGAGADARVLVLHQDGRTVGLKVDAIKGLLEVASNDLIRLHHDDDPEEVFHSAARAPEGGQVLSLLDCGRLAQLAAAWRQDDGHDPAHDSAHRGPQPQAAAAGVSAHAPEAPLYALLQVGAQRLAVPAGALAEVIPMPALERFGGGIDSQWCRWRGRHLPVLAPAAVLPAAVLPALPSHADGRPAAPLLAVIERDGVALGLPVEAALRLQHLDGAGLGAPGGLSASAFDGDGHALHMLDAAALFAQFPQAALSREAGPAQSEREAGNATAYIVFEADGLAAAAIDSVERILGPHEAAAALGAMADGAPCMAWDGRAIPVRDLRPPAQAHAAPHLLLMRGADGLHACAVARVHLLVTPGSGRVYRLGTGPRALEFITTGEGAAQASYRILDLAATRSA
jgi:chemotaxis signal transduction protein